MSRPRAVVPAFLVVAAAVTTLAQQTPRPQTPTQPPPAQQPPVFRAGVETVAIYATVLDRYGEMVLTLNRNDFHVSDNGQRQTLTQFERGLQPITAMLLLDMSASMGLNINLAKAAAEQFVIRMLPGDRAGFGTFSDRVDLVREFTGDRDELLEAIRGQLHIGNPTRLWDAIDQTMTQLRPVGGRRIMVLLTDGGDTMSDLQFEAVLARARTDELMIYVVEFQTTPQAARAEIPLAPTAAWVFGGSGAGARRGIVGGLRRLAEQTGGGHFLLGEYDDINTTFTRVMQELHYQYILGFAPAVADGRVHSLETRVDRPNVVVRARRSYLAPKGPDTP
jgi:Ca-activated chloride channel family protein